ncbi:IS4/Tn5 family transposase DNA-binding protein, partial [Aliagarivorans taiwanensis]
MDSSNPMEWAQAQFSQAELNDPRRTQRLISLAASLASQPGVAVSKLAIS